MDMDFRRTLKKRRPKQLVPVRVSAASTVMGGGPKRKVAMQERGAKNCWRRIKSMPRKFIFHQSDGCLSMDPPNEEIIQGVYKKSIREGEERLMLAVLESAVEDFQKYVLARNPRGKQLFQHAEGWFLEKDGEGLFSFEKICETLGLHPDHIQTGLMVWKEARLKTSSLQAHPASRPKLASSRIEQPAIVPRQYGYRAKTYDSQTWKSGNR